MAVDMEEGAQSDWESLPSELLCLVFSRLPLSDLIRSAVVCKQWRLSAYEAYDDGDRTCSLPWLWGKDTRDFYSFPDCRAYYLDMPEEMLEGERPHDVGLEDIHEDWFVVLTSSLVEADKNNFYLYFLYNPFSRARIDLPPIYIHSPRRRFNDCHPRFAFSCNPSDRECVVAFFRHRKEGIGLCNAVPGGGGADKEVGWKMFPCNTRTTYVDLAFYNGSIYLATRYGALHVADTVSVEIKIALPSPPKQNLPYELALDVPYHYLRVMRIREYTLKASGVELLMLCSMPVPSYCETPIAIYRANFELGRWEILQSLRGQAILLGPLSLISVSKPDELQLGLEGDCIYLLGGDHPIRKLRLTQQSCRTFNLVEDKDRRLDFRPSSFHNRRFFMLTPPRPKF